MINKKEVIEVLQTCFDPEIPIDLWNLGLIYDISIKNKNIRILMTLTTPGCSMAQYMAEDIKNKIVNIDKNCTITVDITFEPIWEPKMMTDKGKEMLGFNIKENKSSNNNWE